MGSTTHKSLWPLAFMVMVLAVVFGSLVTAGPEQEQGAESWPHGVTVPGTTVKAFERLKQIHEFALTALQAAEPQEDKEPILRVIRAAFVCVAYDGKAPIPPNGNPPQEPPPPPPDHSLQHFGAAAKIQAAWTALQEPAGPNWNLCAENLEHGHEE